MLNLCRIPFCFTMYSMLLNVTPSLQSVQAILGNITGTYYNFNLCIGKSHVQIINRRQQFYFYTQYTILTLFVEPHNLIWTIYCYRENWPFQELFTDLQLTWIQNIHQGKLLGEGGGEVMLLVLKAAIKGYRNVQY